MFSTQPGLPPPFQLGPALNTQGKTKKKKKKRWYRARPVVGRARERVRVAACCKSFSCGPAFPFQRCETTISRVSRSSTPAFRLRSSLPRPPPPPDHIIMSMHGPTHPYPRTQILFIYVFTVNYQFTKVANS